MKLQADAGELSRFVDALFRYADSGTFVSLRSFHQFDSGVSAQLIRAVEINGSLEPLVQEADLAATESATHPWVFAPPVCTFANADRARVEDLANGLTLSVEVDDNPDEARRRLELLLGPVTLAVASGSDWLDADTGELRPKLHLHWRLTEPTRMAADHLALRQCRDMAARLVGADPTGKPVVHPLRWPGSWNVKLKPRMAKIVAWAPDREIDLADSLDLLEDAIDAAGLAKAGLPVSGNPTDVTGTYAAAIRAIPNPGIEVHYDQWIRYGYACWRAGGGSPDAFDAWDAWSRKSDKYNAGEQEAAWARIGRAISGSVAPRTIGAGTLIFDAYAAGWTRPLPALFEQPSAPEVQPDPIPNDDWAAPEPVPPEPPQVAPPKLILTLAELETLPDPAWLVDGLIPKGGLVVPYGPPKAGKSFILVSLGLHIAAGKDWFGKRVHTGAVIYIAGEGVGGLKHRVKAMLQAYEIPREIPFWIIRRAVNFRSQEEVEALAKLCTDTLRESQYPNVELVWIVVDTLARALPGADENSAQDVGLAVSYAAGLQEHLGCGICFIHHEGKDEGRGARGTTALRGAWDAAFRITKQGLRTTMQVIDQKDAEAGQVMHFEMREQQVGIGRTSLVPWLTEGDISGIGQNVPFVPPSGKTGIALNALQNLVASTAGAILPPFDGIPANVRGAQIDQWRRAFYEQQPASDQTARKKAFQRAVDTLQTRGLVGVHDPWVWLAQDRTTNETQEWQ